MKKEIIKYSFLLVVIIIVLTFVYPGIYRYDKYNQKIPIRINRITGKTEIFSENGWRDIKKENNNEEDTSTTFYPESSPSPSNKSEVDQNGYTFDEYFEKIKQNTDHPEKLDKSHEYVIWRQKVLGLIPYSLYPDDDGERFSIGSSMNDVKEVMGTPDSVSKIEFIHEEIWHYKMSSVTFKNGKVFEYSNLSDNLKVE